MIDFFTEFPEISRSGLRDIKNAIDSIYDDLKTILASDLPEPTFRVIEFGHGSSMDYYELTEGMTLNSEATELGEYSQKEFTGELFRVIWQLAEIIWNDNCNHELPSYSVQATLF